MLKIRATVAAIIGGLLFSTAAGAGPADCHLGKVAELPVRMEHDQPLTDARIDGKRITALLDTGAQRTAISAAGARRLGLPVTWFNSQALGVGGLAAVGAVHVQSMALGGWRADGLSLMVLDNSSFGPGVEMIVGQDIFSQTDVELDLAHDTIRFFTPHDCDDTPLAYWADSYAEALMKPMQDRRHSHYQVYVKVDGRQLLAVLDTGASSSLLNSSYAHELGVQEGDQGVVAAGKVHGIGADRQPSWVGVFDSVAIGDEVVKNVRLRFSAMASGLQKDDFGDYHTTAADWSRQAFPMVLGMDFIKAHRIYVARSQNKLYFTNVSSPIFDTRKLD